jgi:TIR domain-containing protein
VPKPLLRAFISYSTKDKLIGADVKRILGDFGVDSFLAHDDLRVSEEWEERILHELSRCDIFVPLLSKAFRSSDWASQETGIAVTRKTLLVIPLSVDGTMPFGFISHLQGKKIPVAGIPVELFRDPLLKRFPRRVIPRLIERVEHAWSFRDAEAAVEPLVEIRPLFTRGEANQFATAAVNNRQVWSASLCRSKYLPAFLKLHRNNIKRRTRQALEYQVRYDRPFSG